VKVKKTTTAGHTFVENVNGSTKLPAFKLPFLACCKHGNDPIPNQFFDIFKYSTTRVLISSSRIQSIQQQQQLTK
jgi:hypothetical protein